MHTHASPLQAARELSSSGINARTCSVHAERLCEPVPKCMAIAGKQRWGDYCLSASQAMHTHGVSPGL